MLFYKVLILFWGCTRICSHASWFENRIILYNIARHIKVVTLLLLLFFWLNHVLDGMSTTAYK